jgi:Ca2+-binding EF-hand superfamily protein
MTRTFWMTSLAIVALACGSIAQAADDNHSDATATSATKTAQNKTTQDKAVADKADADKAVADKLSALFDKLDANHDGQITPDEVPDDQRRLFERLLRRADANGDGKLSREEFITGMKEMETQPEQPADRPAAASDRPNNEPQNHSPGDHRPGEAAGGGGPFGGRAAGGFGGAAGGLGGGGPLVGMALFRALDTNGDGKLDAKEIAAAPEVLKKLANNNGEITRDELLKSMPGMAGGFGGGAGGGFAFGGFGAGGGPPGAGGAGEPNPDAMVKRFIQQFDKNGDGKLEKDELPPRLQERFDELDTNHDGVLDESELKAILPRLMRRLQEDRSPGAGGAQDRPLRRIQSEAKSLADKMLTDDKKSEKAEDKSTDKTDHASDKTDNTSDK